MADGDQSAVSKEEQRKLAKAQKSAEKAAKAEKARARAAAGEGGGGAGGAGGGGGKKAGPSSAASSSRPAGTTPAATGAAGGSSQAGSSRQGIASAAAAHTAAVATSSAAQASSSNTTPRSHGASSASPAGSRPSRVAGGVAHSALSSSTISAVSTSQQTPAPALSASTPARKNLQFFGNVSLATSRPLPSTHLVAGYSRKNVIIHPSVLALAVQLSNMSVVGANARALAVLGALRDFVADYRTPAGAALSRDLVTKLGPQISHLVEARPLGTSVGNSIRYLKYEISVVPPEMDETEAKEHLLSRIDHFVRDRIVYAGRVIEGHAGSKIRNGDTVLTFGRSSVVQGTLLAAQAAGKRFHVIVVDSRPLLEGKENLATLLKAGIPCTYGLLTSLATLIPRASLVLLGTASLLANGALYARSGTASCAMLAQARAVPVIVCCETYKFSDRVQLDAFVANEAADPSALLTASSSGGATGTATVTDPASTPENDAEVNARGEAHKFGSGKPLALDEVDNNPALSVVNLLYDLTPPRYISAVASEVGLSGPESVGVILRDYKSVLYGV